VNVGRVINVPPRGIGAKSMQQMADWARSKDLPMFSAMQEVAAARLADEACPVDIDLPRMLVALRGRTRKRRGTLGERIGLTLLRWSFSSVFMYRLSTGLQAFFMRCISGKSDRLRSAPGPFSGWTRERDLVIPDRRSFRQRWRERGGSTR
jgi:L-lactate utilization protein LutB